MTTKQPLTPQQALNNFKLFLELSPRNSYKEYRAAVQELATTCLNLGIEGDDNHKPSRRTRPHNHPSRRAA